MKLHTKYNVTYNFIKTSINILKKNNIKLNAIIVDFFNTTVVKYTNKFNKVLIENKEESLIDVVNLFKD